MSPRARNADGGLSEAAFQRQVLGLASFYGWRAYHTYDSRRSHKGFPDLVLVRGPELLFVELKTNKGRIRPEQAEWLNALHEVEEAVDALVTAADATTDAAGASVATAVEVHLWQPAHFDELHQRLARGRHLVPAHFAGNVAA